MPSCRSYVRRFRRQATSGAQSGARTRTSLRTPEFESGASTSCATCARRLHAVTTAGSRWWRDGESNSDHRLMRPIGPPGPASRYDLAHVRRLQCQDSDPDYEGQNLACCRLHHTGMLHHARALGHECHGRVSSSVAGAAHPPPPPLNGSASRGQHRKRTEQLWAANQASVGMPGFEPGTSAPQTPRATKLRHIPIACKTIACKTRPRPPGCGGSRGS